MVGRHPALMWPSPAIKTISFILKSNLIALYALGVFCFGFLFFLLLLSAVLDTTTLSVNVQSARLRTWIHAACLKGKMEGYIIGNEYSTELGSLRREEEISEIKTEICAAHGQKS